MTTRTQLATNPKVSFLRNAEGQFHDSGREAVIFEGKMPFKVVHFRHGVLWLLLLGWNIGLLFSWFKCLGNKVKITSQRILWVRGLISQRAEEVEYYRVKDSTFQQTILGRLLGIGSITLLSDDASAPLFTIPIHNPKALREQIRNFIREQRYYMRSLQVD